MARQPTIDSSTTEGEIKNPPDVWRCYCGCLNGRKQVDCYSCGSPRIEGEVVPIEDVGQAIAAAAAEPAGVPPDVSKRLTVAVQLALDAWKYTNGGSIERIDTMRELEFAWDDYRITQDDKNASEAAGDALKAEYARGLKDGAASEAMLTAAAPAGTSNPPDVPGGYIDGWFDQMKSRPFRKESSRDYLAGWVDHRDGCPYRPPAVEPTTRPAAAEPGSVYDRQNAVGWSGWTCACGHVETRHKSFCGSCQRDRPRPTAEPAGVENPPDGWKCFCGCNNRPNQVDCYSCGQPRPAASELVKEPDDE